MFHSFDVFTFLLLSLLSAVGSVVLFVDVVVVAGPPPLPVANDDEGNDDDDDKAIYQTETTVNYGAVTRPVPVPAMWPVCRYTLWLH